MTWYNLVQPNFYVTWETCRLYLCTCDCCILLLQKNIFLERDHPTHFFTISLVGCKYDFLCFLVVEIAYVVGDLSTISTDVIWEKVNATGTKDFFMFDVYLLCKYFPTFGLPSLVIMEKQLYDCRVWIISWTLSSGEAI